MKKNLYVTGFMGTGKSIVAKTLAQRMGKIFIDMDQAIQDRQGKSITDIFNQLGEGYFRKLENNLLKEIVQRDDLVVATGGGTLLLEKNVQRASKKGIIICLKADPIVIYDRLKEESKRPLLLKGKGNKLEQIKHFMEKRKHNYERFSWQIDTSNLTVKEVVDKIVNLLEKSDSNDKILGENLTPNIFAQVTPVKMRNILMQLTEKKECKIIIKEGILSKIGEYLDSLLDKKDVFILTNPLVKNLHGEKLLSGFYKYGFNVKFFEIPDGEEYKTLSMANEICNVLLREKVNRLTTLISFGGGVVGDLAGFVAATYMRGVPLIHIPTTLLAQVDSSIGGKVAVDHPSAKNIIGSFYHPIAVFTDPLVLKTLSLDNLKNGLVEIIKISIIDSPSLFKLLDMNVAQLLEKDVGLFKIIINKATKLKVQIVLKDPWEKNERKYLNFGHSIGHALETTFGYQNITHGEAVALGMIMETKIACHRKICSPELETKIKNMITKLNISFNIDLKKMNNETIWETIAFDKKNSSKKICFVLPQKIGQVSLVEDITKDEVMTVLDKFKEEL